MERFDGSRTGRPLLAALCAAACAAAFATAPPPAAAGDDSVFPLCKPEQNRLLYHNPAALPALPLPGAAAPPTLADETPYSGSRTITLDEAIAIALRHSEVVRVLSGTFASASGSTVYEAAIANQAVDQQRAAFDPRVVFNNTFSQVENPGGSFTVLDTDNPINPGDPDLRDSVIVGNQVESFSSTLDVSQRNLAGGTARYRFNTNQSFINPGTFALNPQNRFFNEVSYTQPLLRGAGVCANRVPIVLARNNAERSFFRLSASVQELVRGVVDAYWGVVFARTDLWARRIQVEQSEAAFKRAEARFRNDLADISEVAQTRSALASFRAQLLAAEGNLLTREAALLNILGLPPTYPEQLIPTTPPVEERLEFDWLESVALAQQRRPDLIELKLILEADSQQLLQSRNQARPTLDAVALYRWNGIVGTTPGGGSRSSNQGEFTDWTMGVNFSVPLYLRAERAGVRQAELVIARDRANLQQGVHNARHALALTFRNLEQTYQQYEAFVEAREAARLNLNAQLAEYRSGREEGILINLLSAISDFGNAVSQEANTLLQYNTTLAQLERETGTILETHGVFLAEDLRCSLGPCWLRHDDPTAYSHAHRPVPNVPRYGDTPGPSEEAFDLDATVIGRNKRKRPADEGAVDGKPDGDVEETPAPVEDGPGDAPRDGEGTPLPPLPETVDDVTDRLTKRPRLFGRFRK